MAKDISLVVFPAKDLDAAKKVYTTFLGVEPYADSPYYVGYKAGNLEVGIVPSSENIVSYIDVEDLEASLKELEAAGATVHMAPKNVGGGLMVASVKDAQGNELGMRQQPK